jgi:F-type H+-transporting ATPase subunit delta
MADYALTARYVQALLEDLPTDRLGRVQEELCEAAELWRTSSPFRQVMANPFIPAEEKRDAMERIAARADWSEPVRHFLGVLVVNGRVQLLDEIAPVVADFVRDRLDREVAIIESPTPLADDEVARLAQQLGEQLGVTLIPQLEVRPELIGGVRVRVGDTMYDATIVGTLRSLREELTKGRAL